jgi:hypothetical protein
MPLYDGKRRPSNDRLLLIGDGLSQATANFDRDGGVSR